MNLGGGLPIFGIGGLIGLFVGIGLIIWVGSGDSVVNMVLIVFSVVVGAALARVFKSNKKKDSDD